MLKYHCRASDVASLPDPPKSYVLLSAGCESRWIDGTEFEAQDVELWSLSGTNLWHLSSCYSWDIPDADELFIVLIFSNTCQIAAIVREAEALERYHRHGHHSKAASCGIVPYSDYGVLSFLSWGKHRTLFVEIEAAHWSRVTKEEPLLLVALRIHSNDCSSWGEENHIFAILLWPFEIHTLVCLVSNDVLELHDWILVELVRPW